MTILATLASLGYGIGTKRTSEEKSGFSWRAWRAAASVTILISTMATLSCVDLSAIGHLAKSSQDLGTSFKKIADNAEPACEKATSYINSLPLDAPRRSKPLPNCAFYKTVNPLVLDVNDALFKYIAALGKLASAGKSKDAFSKVDTDLKKFDPNIDPKYPTEAKAAGALADALTNLLASQYQQRELAKIIENANPYVKDVAAFLSDYAADQYDLVLQEEGLDEGLYCTDRNETFGKAGLEPLANKLLQDRCDAHAARIKSQRDAIAKYQDALKAISDGHQKLYEDRNKWNTKQIVDDLGPDILKVGSAAIAVNTAF
jgi:hypothetical protein